MRRRWRVALILAVVVVGLIVFALVNRANLGATYWTARAQNCGSLALATNALVTSTADAQRVESCYAQAAAHCQPAVMVVNTVAVDSNATYTFVVEPSLTQQGVCSLAVIIDVSNGSGDNNATASCQSATQQPKALHIAACGGLGDVTLPAIHAASGTIGAPQSAPPGGL